MSVGRCPTERKPGVGVREGIHRQGTIARARVVLERALVAGTLDLSWGGSPLPVGVSTLERTPGSVRVDHSMGGGPTSRSPCSGGVARIGPGRPLREPGPGPVGCSTGGVGGARKGLVAPLKSPAGFCPNTPGEFPPVASARGRGHTLARFRPGALPPMRETDSAREASPESLVELNPNFSGGSCPSSPLNADHLPPPPWHSKPVVSKSYPGCPSGHTPPSSPWPGRVSGLGWGGRGGWSGSPLCASRRRVDFLCFPRLASSGGTPLEEDGAVGGQERWGSLMAGRQVSTATTTN